MYALGMVVVSPLLPLKNVPGNMPVLMLVNVPADMPLPAAALAGDNSILAINAARSSGVELALFTVAVFKK